VVHIHIRVRHLGTPCLNTIAARSTFRRAMCPPYRLEPRTPPPEIPFQDWIDTAICCRTSCYIHRIEEYLICNECFDAYFTGYRHQFDSIERHFVYFGAPETLDECSSCSVLITRRQVPDACPTCRHVVQDFVIYLRESGENPYESDEGTLLAIEEIISNLEEITL